MKKTFFYAAILCIVPLLSCSRNEESIINENALSNSDNKTSSRLAPTNEILEFKSFEHFDETVEDLYKKIEIHDDAFLKKYGHLSEDELDDVEDKLNYNDFQPVVDFEKEKNFKSLRAIIAEKEEKWLIEQGDREVLDEKTDPDNHFIVDDVERALLNEHAEVKIGDSYYKYYEWGLVKTKSYENLVKSRFLGFHNGIIPILINWDFLIIWINNNSGSSTSSCKKNITREHRYINGHNGRRSIKVKHKVRKRQTFGPSKIVTIIKGYKKRRRKWRKRRTPIGIQFNGDVFLNCTASNYISRYKSVRRRRSRRAKLTVNPNAGEMGIKNQEIKVKATQYGWSISKDLYDNSHMSN